MRVIAGEFRGRRLIAPSGDVTRPITDRVKQSLFDILTPLLPDARVADCFAGTGSMGLECLSRGSAFVEFFETDRSAVERLRQNIKALGVAERCKVRPGDLFSWFKNPANTPAPKRSSISSSSIPLTVSSASSRKRCVAWLKSSRRDSSRPKALSFFDTTARTSSISHHFCFRTDANTAA